MAEPERRELTEIALTLGRWGRAPLTVQQQRRVLDTYVSWADQAGARVRVELYARPHDQLALLGEWVSRSDRVAVIVREQARSDRYRRIAAALAPDFSPGSVDTVIDVPVSRELAAVTWQAGGVARAPEFAARAARDAALTGLSPEIALADIARAHRDDVLAVIDAVTEEARARGVSARWRLVDATGCADPLPGARLPRSLPAWLRLLERERGIDSERVTVQAANTLALANANTVAAIRAGAAPAASLFGTGLGAGWAAAEVMLAHMHGGGANVRPLLNLRDTLAAEAELEHAHRSIGGASAWQFPGGAAPESPRPELLRAWFPLDPRRLTGRAPEPVLTELSGHAGLLHLLHRAFPERHFETDDARIVAISERFEREFAAGRQIPVAWAELLPLVRDAGLLEGA